MAADDERINEDAIPRPGGGSTQAELEERRTKVLSLHLRKFNQTQIAQAVGVDQSQVSRDLKWIHEHWRDKYGPPQGIVPEEEIGEAISMFAEIEATAIRDMSKLKIENAKQRNAYMRTVLLARQMRINLLQDLGFIDRKGPDLRVTLRADVVRSALREEGLLMIGKGQTVAAAAADEAEDEIEKWMRRAE